MLATVAAVGETLNEHEPAACVTATACPATVTVAVRAEVESFADTCTVTVTAGRVSSASTFVGLGGGQLCLATSTVMNVIVDVTGGA